MLRLLQQLPSLVNEMGAVLPVALENKRLISTAALNNCGNSQCAGYSCNYDACIATHTPDCRHRCGDGGVSENSMTCAIIRQHGGFTSGNRSFSACSICDQCYA